MKTAGAAAAILALAVVGYVFLAERETEAPAAFYERYRATVLEGRSFAEDAAFQSARKRAEVESDLSARGGDADEIKAMYLEFTARLEGCGTRKLVSEEVTGDSARLVYDIVDCSDYAEAESAQDIIVLVKEDGWKIDSNETSIRN